MRITMNRLANSRFHRNRASQRGMSLVETMIALAILLVVAAGVMSLAVVALSTTETQGHLTARTAEYAQDKMEQLMALTFCDGGTDGVSGTNTTVFPATTNPAGTGLGGCTAATIGNVPPAAPPTPLTGGSLNTTAPSAGYVDYLDASGNLVGATANWEYMRAWQISQPAGSVGMKQISVRAQVRRSIGTNNGLLPTTTVVALKTFPF
jgi:prepilin-type N-terminal cleavage/methylation domain-containing protein